MSKQPNSHPIELVARGNARAVASRLQEETTITTFSAGIAPILTGSIEFPRVTLYRSRPPLRAMRFPTYFEGRLRDVEGHAILEGRVVTSEFHSLWFGLIIGGWFVIAALMVVASIASRSWKAVGVGVPLGSVLGLAAYGLIRVRMSAIKAESELLVGEIRRVLEDERLTIG